MMIAFLSALSCVLACNSMISPDGVDQVGAKAYRTLSFAVSQRSCAPDSHPWTFCVSPGNYAGDELVLGEKTTFPCKSDEQFTFSVRGSANGVNATLFSAMPTKAVASKLSVTIADMSVAHVALDAKQGVLANLDHVKDIPLWEVNDGTWTNVRVETFRYLGKQSKHLSIAQSRLGHFAVTPSGGDLSLFFNATTFQTLSSITSLNKQEFWFDGCDIRGGNWFSVASSINMMRSQGVFNGDGDLFPKEASVFASDSTILMNATYPGNFGEFRLMNSTFSTVDNKSRNASRLAVETLRVSGTSTISCDGGYTPFVCKGSSHYGCFLIDPESSPFDRCDAVCAEGLVIQSAVTCKRCDASSIADADGKTCTPCQKGSFRDAAGVKCVPCDGYVSNDGMACIHAPAPQDPIDFHPRFGHCGGVFAYGDLFKGHCDVEDVLPTLIPAVILLIGGVVFAVWMVRRKRSRQGFTPI